jgi:hypothetical protein
MPERSNDFRHAIFQQAMRLIKTLHESIPPEGFHRFELALVVQGRPGSACIITDEQNDIKEILTPQLLESLAKHPPSPSEASSEQKPIPPADAGRG